MILAVIVLCLNLIWVQGPVLGFAFNSPGQDGEWLEVGAARLYMVQLINKDRISFGLQPVQLDQIATEAGQQHSDEMALSKYVSHWDLHGRKPDQRYSESGGSGAVAENALATSNFAENEVISLAAKQMFHKSELEYAESLFFNEKAPYDGHRKNILNPNHNKVGIGLTRSLPGQRITCTQEFVNQYGAVSKLPVEQIRGSSLALAGELPKGISIYCVSIYREMPPHPMTPAELKKTYSYSLPAEDVANYFPPPYFSQERMNLKKTANGESFSLNLQSKPDWKPGLYYVTVWVKKSDSATPLATSTQTIALN